MPSITSKQASLINSGLLSGLGSTDRGDSLTLSNTANTLVNMAESIITEAQKNLNNKGSVATGDLEASLHAENIEIQGTSMSIDIMILDRYRFINDGVKGVESGSGKYSFKTIKPSIGMKNAIKSWLRKRGKRAMKYKAISKTERKDKGIAKMKKQADSQEGLAWAVATSIKKKGIKPTKFFTKAIKTTEQKFAKEIAAGFKLDIIESLK